MNLPDPLLEHLRSRLLSEPPERTMHDDYHLPDEHAAVESAAAMHAAVLIPVIVRPPSLGGPGLLFTRRTESLARHSGQVSFPGGRVDPSDLTPVQTALRETMEETGIDPGFITVAGYLDRYLTGTGFDIQPVVGLLSDGYALAPNAAEVAEIFEVPLSFLADPANRIRQTRDFAGRTRRFYSITYGAHEIWGATAAIVVDFAERLENRGEVRPLQVGPTPPHKGVDP